MNWWRRWKAKHWDEVQHPAGTDGLSYWLSRTETPRFRAVVRRLLEQAEANPLTAVAVLAGILGSIATIIALLV